MNDELCHLIEDAFSEAPKPAFGTLSVPTYDDEGTNAYFGRTDWRAHDVEGLRAHGSALSFFTPAAFRYYLPAFLFASIKHPAKAVGIAQGIIFHLQRDLTAGRERLREFSPGEREALARFIEWLADQLYPPFPRQSRQRRGHLELTELANALRVTSITATPRREP